MVENYGQGETFVKGDWKISICLLIHGQLVNELFRFEKKQLNSNLGGVLWPRYAWVKSL